MMHKRMDRTNEERYVPKCAQRAEANIFRRQEGGNSELEPCRDITCDKESPQERDNGEKKMLCVRVRTSIAENKDQ
jgi:hypothetical protein